MQKFIERIVAKTWNKFTSSTSQADESGPRADLGVRIVDGEVKGRRMSIPEAKRAEHMAILGKTGQGKSFFLRHLSLQDVRARRGFVFFDLHGDLTPFLLAVIAAEEQRTRMDLSERLIVIEPADGEFSVGLNVLEAQAGPQNYVQLAEFAQILQSRWKLEFGARTEELLRNSLHVLADNRLTLLELTPLLTNPDFRAVCLRQVQNTEVVAYFASRYDTRSEAMQATYRDAILNKISGFTTDLRFRHILGQQRSTFSLLDAMDHGQWVIVNLDKGRLGDQAATLGSLLLTKLKNALFTRRNRQLFTFYCDEIQNLVAYSDSSLETLLSESRKFGTAIVTANQFLQQYPEQMRAAIMAVGTHIFFQLSSTDADKISSALDGGKRLGEQLKNLPKRHMVVKTGASRPQEVLVPHVEVPTANYADLYNRCRRRWARRRTEIEAQIRERQRRANPTRGEVLNDWD